MSGSSLALRNVPFTFAGRVTQETDETNPEELLAAAHAACFAMALASQLSARELVPDRLTVMATVALDERDGMNRIVESVLSVEAAVQEPSAELFDEAVAAADRRCPFSALVRASGKVGLDVNLIAAG
jgi:osmotically inducible protein OsmC